MGVTFHEDVVFNGTDEAEKPGRCSQFVDNLKQQRLVGTYPVVTRKHAISTTTFFGLLFIGISLLLKSANRQVILIKHRYDNATNGTINFEILKDIPPPVYFYYELHNTFMMHRSLNRAFCELQLTGSFWDEDFRYHCNTFKNRKYTCADPKKQTALWITNNCFGSEQIYAPIGGTAAIMFNDSFLLSRNGEPIDWTEDGVISDENRKIILHPKDTSELCTADMFNKTIKPIGWERHICEMGGYRNNTFLKWLEPSTNQNFKKFYRILDTRNNTNGLLKGEYELHTDNIYWPQNSREHNMTKYFWILHPSWVGTEQKFLEVLYLIVGMGLLLLASFLIGFQIFMMNRRKIYSDDDE